ADPPLAGLTTRGKEKLRRTRSRTLGAPTSRNNDCVKVVKRGVEPPARATIDFAIGFDHETRAPVASEPTNGTPASARRSLSVPSSPVEPCRSGQITSG